MPMMTDLCKKRPAPRRERGAIIVHGHRHSCLYRLNSEPDFGYRILNIIVPKILNSGAETNGGIKDHDASGGSISGTMRGVAG